MIHFVHDDEGTQSTPITNMLYDSRQFSALVSLDELEEELKKKAII